MGNSFKTLQFIGIVIIITLYNKLVHSLKKDDDEDEDDGGDDDDDLVRGQPAGCSLLYLSSFSLLADLQM